MLFSYNLVIFFFQTNPKNYNLVEPCGADAAQSTSAELTTKTNCFIFQETMLESPTSPSQNTHQDKETSYDILAGHLKRFNELGFLPNYFLLSRLDECRGGEAGLDATNHDITRPTG